MPIRLLFALCAWMFAGSALAQVVDYSIAITDAPDPVTRGATLTYEYTIASIGSVTGEDIAVELALPSSVGFVSLIPPTGAPVPFVCTTPAVGGSGVVRCTTTSFWVGSIRTFTVQVKVLAPSGTITSTATVFPLPGAPSYFQDFLPDDNTAVATTTIRPTAPAARAVPATSAGALAALAASCALLGVVLLQCHRDAAGPDQG